MTKTLVEQHTIGYSTVQRQNGSMYQGETKVVTAGKSGTAALTYRMVYVDGKPRRQDSGWAYRHRSPRHGRRERGHQGPAGTRAYPGASPCTRPPAPAPPASGGGGLNWDGVAAGESGGNWSIRPGMATTAGSSSTWAPRLANGGGAYAPRPDLASSPPIAVATSLYQKAGSDSVARLRAYSYRYL